MIFHGFKCLWYCYKFSLYLCFLLLVGCTRLLVIIVKFSLFCLQEPQISDVLFIILVVLIELRLQHQQARLTTKINLRQIIIVCNAICIYNILVLQMFTGKPQILDQLYTTTPHAVLSKMQKQLCLQAWKPHL